MAKHIRIGLKRRDVSCVARLLEDKAPRTCAVVWDALPLTGDAFHATYAGNEVYTMLPPVVEEEPPLEYPTVTPIPGDICYYPVAASSFTAAFLEERGLSGTERVLDLNVFYDRNNFLLSPDFGLVPCTVFASIEENLAEMAQACADVWRNGCQGEQLTFARAE